MAYHLCMKEALRWALIAIALLVVGPIVGRVVGEVRSPTGGPDATMLVSDSLSRSIGATLVAMAAASFMGVLGARLVSVKTGMFVAGAVLIWPAFTSAAVAGVIRESQSAGPLWRLALEGLLLGAIAVGATVLISRAGSRHEGEDEVAAPLGSAETAIVIGAAALVGGVAAWVVAREGLKGQTFAAGAIAGVAAGVVGRVAAHQAAMAAYMVGMAVLAAAGPALAAGIDGGDIVGETYANTLIPLGWLAPLDWIGGAFFGLPLGITWGASMLEKRGHGE